MHGSNTRSSKITTTDDADLETKTFEKFGSEYAYMLRTERRKQWTPVVKLPNGTILDTTKEKWADNIPKGVKPSNDWIETDQTLVASYVVGAKFRDNVDCPEWKHIWLYGTLDGSMLGIEDSRDKETVELLDPCIVRFDDIKGAIHLIPIFNVARRLSLQMSAVRSIQAPSEPIIGLYPGFVIQNKMFKYQMKPRVSLVSSEKLDNEGLDVQG